MLYIVAVVIDNLAVTNRCVSSIREFTPMPYELILVDNASADPACISAYQSTADVFFRFPTRTDLAKAWNKGIELASGDSIAVVNNDTVVPPRWSETLQEALHNHPEAGMVSPLTFNLMKRYVQKGRFQHFDQSFSQPFRLRRFKEIVWGEFCLFKRAALEDVGGYCDLYQEASGEDLEMCFQLFDKGWDILVDPRVFVYHQGGASLGLAGRNAEERSLLWKRNNALFKSRWRDHLQT